MIKIVLLILNKLLGIFVRHSNLKKQEVFNATVKKIQDNPVDAFNAKFGGDYNGMPVVEPLDEPTQDVLSSKAKVKPYNYKTQLKQKGKCRNAKSRRFG